MKDEPRNRPASTLLRPTTDGRVNRLLTKGPWRFGSRSECLSFLIELGLKEAEIEWKALPSGSSPKGQRLRHSIDQPRSALGT